MHRPHFLEEPLYKLPSLSWPWFLFGTVLSLGLTILYSYDRAYAVTLGLILLLIWSIPRVQRFGIYAIAAVAFFHGLEIVFEQYPSFRHIPWLSTINAPFVDFVALFVLISVLFAWMLGVLTIRWRQLYRLFPWGVLYVAFLGIGYISALHAYEGLGLVSLKYWYRPMVFVYILYAVLPLVLIQKKSQLEGVLRLLTWIGAGIALFGWWGFLHSIGGGGWPRVQPGNFFGLAPLGYNHNMIGEVLSALLPIAWYVAEREERTDAKRVYQGILLCILAAALATLSRAAWITIGAELVLAAWIFRARLPQTILPAIKRFFVPVAFVFVCIIGYMAVFLESSVVESSNAARLMTTEVSLFYVMRQPILGYGPGMYVFLLQDVMSYTLDFGDALDAHGMLIKLLLETGLLGTLACIGFLSIALYRMSLSAKQSHQLLLGTLCIAATGAVVYQLFNTSYFNSHMWFPIGFALAAYQLSRYGEEYLSEE